MEYCAILIPCYNEEKQSAKVVRDWKKEIPGSNDLCLR